MASSSEILAIARGEIGVKESPKNSNNVKYNTWYYGKSVSGAAYPWCMAFAQWVYEQAKSSLPHQTASCGELLRWYRKYQPDCVTETPIPGSLVIFDFPGGAATDHVGLLEGLGQTTVTTIDGNTGVTSDANGGAVMRRTRSKKLVAAYIQPRELEADVKRYQTIAEIKAEAPWAAETIQKLMSRKALKGDGTGLDLSYDMLRMLVINERMGMYK